MTAHPNIVAPLDVEANARRAIASSYADRLRAALVLVPVLCWSGDQLGRWIIDHSIGEPV